MSNEPGRNLLADLRKRLGISQSQMAKILGCTQSRISKLESAPTQTVSLIEVASYVRATAFPIVLRFLSSGGLEVSPIDEAATSPQPGGNGANWSLSASRSTKQLDELRETLKTLEQRNAFLEARMGQLREVNSALEEKIAAERTMILSLENTVGQRSAELASQKETLRSHRERMEALEGQLEAVQHELATAHQIMHVGQKERVREALLSPQQRQERAMEVSVTPNALK